MADSLGVYISVPFCRAKCTYCNFASGVFAPGRMRDYVERVCREVGGARVSAEEMGAAMARRVDSVFLGGGTPSLLSGDQIKRLFEALRGEFEVVPGAEITLECAPGQLGDETLEELLRAGMNRVSFGVQSFVDREAAAVGRLHTRAQCLAEIARLRAAGVENLNVDLIVGLPHQTARTWRESVETAIASGVPHVSVYMLEVDEDSRLGREMLETGRREQGAGRREVRYGAGEAPTEDETADWYGAACEWLEGAGIRQYEISNFAREGFRSRHNVKYWRREPYVGFGLDAHSMLRASHGGGAVRFANTDDFEEYMAEPKGPAGPFDVLRETQGAARAVERIGREQGFEEAMFLGLRMNEGVDLERLEDEFGRELVGGAVVALEEVEEAGLVEREGARVRLTVRGRMVSNEVFGRLLVVAV